MKRKMFGLDSLDLILVDDLAAGRGAGVMKRPKTPATDDPIEARRLVTIQQDRNHLVRGQRRGRDEQLVGQCQREDVDQGLLAAAQRWHKITEACLGHGEVREAVHCFTVEAIGLLVELQATLTIAEVGRDRLPVEALVFLPVEHDNYG